MEIVIRVSGLEGNSLPFLRLFQSAAESMNLPADSLSQVFITDTNSFGSTIQELDSTQGYTNDQFFLSAGKTIELPNQPGKSVIIITIMQLAHLLEAEFIKKPIEEWDLQAKLSSYIIYHELGHCLDNFRRPNSFNGVPNRSEMFWIDTMVGECSLITASEFAACAHAAKQMQADVYTNEMATTDNATLSILFDLSSRRRMTTGNQALIDELAGIASAQFWRIIIEYTKLVGCNVGNPNLPIPSLTFLKSAPSMYQIFSDLAEHLRNLWNYYPTWSLADLGFMTETWHALAYVNHFSFENRGESDGVYWNGTA
jgi:hypothetical protein